MNKTKQKPRRITEKQEAFARAYYTPTSESFGNGTASARIAGYAGVDKVLRAVASQNLTKTIVIAQKRIIQAKITEKTDVEISELVDKLRQLAAIDEPTAIQPPTNSDIKGAIELLGKYKGMFREVNVNLNADIPSEPTAYRAWLKSELDRLDSQAGIIDSYAKSEPAIATRY